MRPVPACPPEVGAPPASVCFVAPSAYPALSGREDLAHIGGAEQQQVILARELVRRGHQVSFVVLDHGQPDGAEVLPGIRAFTCYRRDAGLPGVRFFLPRLTGLWSAMRRADADVYYQRGADVETALVGAWCRRRNRGFLFAVAHDTNCIARSPLMPRRSERFLFRRGLALADGVIVQTIRQQQLLLATFGRMSTIVRNAASWPPDQAPPAATPPALDGPMRVLWVGRFSEEKRPEWVARLARDLPGCRFDVVGASNHPTAFAARLVEQFASLPNVHWHGYVPHRRMAELYRQAGLLLCTSESEGFPNVFLEAWACGLGVLSTVDPDDLVTRLGMGVHAPDYEGLRRHLLALESTREFWIEAGRRGQAYVRAHHAPDVAADALAGLIGSVCAARHAGRRPVVAGSLSQPPRESRPCAG